ncbi:efflux RND transporter periplasmic adaptor subunit [Desulfovibrio sp. JC010]|uniref:efflux RND transporter periplasmic adaptor subunit n=1 Tax=Desulfovibrio sp. JC010 TaxID=2593641 RepID=UPI0013D615D7|nr:efflux RND transporter periplasmic adaptor subunit [Desulfovibrio sp. JC010]NDV28871.1 efflux RND transporter periplasmic adaptor subunit [Desulfovibrio sp. JC010]
MSDIQSPERSFEASSLEERRKPLRKRVLFWMSLSTIIVVVLWQALVGNGEPIRYKTHTLGRGDLSINVSASGTLQPRTKVKVGCEISGVLKKIHKDYNDPVAKGEIIALLRTDELQARVNQLRAALESAQATVLKCEAALDDKSVEHRRTRKLRSGNAVSQKALDSSRTAEKLASAELAGARAQVKQARANLLEAEANLKKAVIVSPIDGLVLVRHVERGQAVSSNLQTPELFTIAAGLKDMRLELNIDEADVGRIKPGQQAVFTVDAYPERKFRGVLEKLRFSPQRVQGVVTYVGIFAVKNSDLALRPGMTAAAKIETRKVRDKLLVPNAALRFTPPETVPEESRNTPSPKNANVWLLRDGFPERVEVDKGSSDGRFTEIRSDELAAGDEIVLSRIENVAENSMSFSFE